MGWAVKRRLERGRPRETRGPGGDKTLGWKKQAAPGPQGKVPPSPRHPQVGNLSRTMEKINGVARCPYDPRHNSTAVISSQGELYAATVIDFSGRDPAIYRSLGSGPPLRTAQYNSKWLNGKEAQPQGWGLPWFCPSQHPLVPICPSSCPTSERAPLASSRGPEWGRCLPKDHSRSETASR